jgi:hypothetical protein
MIIWTQTPEERAEIANYFANQYAPTHQHLRHIDFDSIETANRIGKEAVNCETLTPGRLADITIALDRRGLLKHKTQPTQVIVQRVAPQPVDTATTLPHQDIAELRDIRNLSDVKRVMALPKEKMAKYMRLRPASPAFHEFNQRIQYIQQHRIIGNPSVAEPQQPPKPATPQAAKLAEIRARVDSLKGYTNSVISFRNRLHAEIREMIADRQSLEQIEKHVVARIRNYENGSIR